MIRFIKEENGKRITEMNIKKLSAFLGIFATVAISLFGWGYSLTREVTTHSVSYNELGRHFVLVEKRFDSQMVEIRSEIKYLHGQNLKISEQLTELLHKQDVRISLLEANLINLRETSNGR